MNIGYFNARGINNVEHWFKLEIDELKSRGHNVRTFTSNPKFGSSPTRNDIEWMDFAHFHFANVAQIYKRIGVPFAISPHANDIFTDNGRSLAIASSHPKCKFVTYQSFYHKRKFKEWEIDKPLVYLPMCCRTKMFKRKNSTLHLTGKNILAGGRLIPKKGLEQIIHLDNLTIFGDGPLRKKLEKMKSNVRFTGWLNGDELKNEMENAWIFLNPSVVTSNGDSDGIPNTIKEAMLMELQVISSPIAGIPELENISLLSNWNNIEECINSTNRIPNKKGRREILNTYSPKVTVNMLEKAMEEYN